MSTPRKTLKKLGISKVAEAGGIVEYRLEKNGLKILLAENHSAPVVTFMALFRVGSRNESIGRTGATHFLEHMMFKGTTERNPADGRGIDDILKPIGALYNATTWMDRTNYFECVPSSELETVVALEADRMRHLVLKQEDRDSEMTVVRNEFERGENDPEDVLMKDMFAHAYVQHPYRIPTIGYRDDVELVPMSALKDFYDTYYWPNNATVLVVGDFDPVEALTLIEKYYGVYPASPEPLPPVYTTEPAQEGERRFVIRRAGDLPRVWVAYHVPEATHADNYALNAAHAVLGGGRKSSRLYKALVDTGLCTSAFAWHNEARDPGLLIVGATVAPGKNPDEVELVIHNEVARLAAVRVPASELNRAKSANRKATVLQAQDPMRWASMLGEAEASADWQWLVNYDNNFDAVTAEDILRVAGHYFTSDNRTVGHFIPKNDTSPAAATSEEPADKEETSEGELKRPLPWQVEEETPCCAPEVVDEPAPPTSSVSFTKQVQKVTLANGLTVLAMQNPGTKAVAVNGIIRAGDHFCPRNTGMVPTLMSHLFTAGTANRSKAEIAETLEEMGSHLGFGAYEFAVKFSSSVVTDDLPAYLELLADVLTNPSFPAEEVAKAKQVLTGWFTQQADSTGSVAENRLGQALYPAGSVFHEPSFEDMIADLDAIGRDEILSYCAEHVSPKSTIVTFVGDMEPEALIALAESSLGSWEGPEAKPLTVSEVEAPETAERIEVFMPDKASVDIVIGLPASVSQSAADWMAAKIANAALGQDTLSSRLGLVVRERHGLTYGIYSRFKKPDFGFGPWKISVTVNPENVDKALELIDQVVAEYREKGITDKELTDEIGRAAGTFQVALRTSAALAAQISAFEFVGLGLEGLDSYVDRITSVTRDEVNEAIRKYFDLGRAVTVLAGTLKK